MKLINIDEGKNTGLFFGHQAPQPCMVLTAIAPFLAGYLVYPTTGVHYSEYSPLTQHPPPVFMSHPAPLFIPGPSFPTNSVS